jgi:hypothetical protein
MTNTGYPHIVRDADGVLRVHEHWFKVIMLIGDHVYGGDSAEQLVRAHPPLTLAQAHMVLAFYYDHKDVIDAELAERERRAGALQAEAQAGRGEDGLRERLRAIRAELDRRLA